MQSNIYIICRDKHTVEIQGNEERMTNLLTAMQNKGVITLKEKGIILNTVDISKILSLDEYKNYIDSTQPKEYILNGTWFDTKEKRVLRHEPWKALELEGKKKLEIEDGRSEEEKAEVARLAKEIGNKFKIS